MNKLTAFIHSLASVQGILTLVIAVGIAYFVLSLEKKKGRSFSFTHLFALLIGTGLYGAVSLFSLDIGPNTSLRIAVILLTLIGTIFGPFVGFAAGFLGHALNDALVSGSVWWSWAFLSALMGLFGGLVALDPEFNVLKGKRNTMHVFMLYIYSLLGLFAGSLAAFLGDVLLYGESAQKVWIQILLANIANFLVVSLVGIPIVLTLIRMRSRSSETNPEE